jgi:membrane protein DedA with SNARE-associated domain
VESTLHIDLSALVQTYGLWAVLIGTALEGETVLLLAGFFAHRGYMSFAAVVAVATVGAFLGDQFWFWLGRNRSDFVIRRFPGVGAAVSRLDPFVTRHPTLAAVCVRFLYGFRTAGPVALGMTRLKTPVFALANAVGALIWATVVTGIGWFFGQAATRLLDDVHRHEGWIALGIALLGVCAFVIYRFYWRRRAAVVQG